MFGGKSVFVIGAGASKEVSLPTGNELMGQIASLLNFDTNRSSDLVILSARGTNGERIHRALQRISQDGVASQEAYKRFQSYMAAADRIRFALPAAPSIDNFIDSHAGDKEVELCGKLAIVQAVLSAERDSKLYVSPDNAYNRLDLTALQDTWYLELTKLLFENCQKSGIAERLSRLSFIIFNYDRCIEHFLWWMLRIYYAMSEQEAAELLKPVNFYHPYGTVGPLPWQGKPGSVAYGEDQADLARLASQIKTFTQGTDENSSNIVDIRAAIDTAGIIVFLGFGFHRLNMQLITPNTDLNPRKSKRYFATAKGLSNPDVEIVKVQLRDMCSAKAHPKNVQVRNDLLCAGLFQEYHLSLSAYK